MNWCSLYIILDPFYVDEHLSSRVKDDLWTAFGKSSCRIPLFFWKIKDLRLLTCSTRSIILVLIYRQRFPWVLVIVYNLPYSWSQYGMVFTWLYNGYYSRIELGLFQTAVANLWIMRYSTVAHCHSQAYSFIYWCFMLLRFHDALRNRKK